MQEHNNDDVNENVNTLDDNLNQKSNSDTINAIDKLLMGDKPTVKATDESQEHDEIKSLSDELAEQSDLIESGSESKEPIIPPKNLNELAEKLGVEVKDLYGIEFPSSDGESHTIGELKDLLANESDFSGRELEFSERKVKFDTQQATARQELEVILKSIPPEALTQDVLLRAQREVKQNSEREAAKTLDVIPEWSSGEAKSADMVKITEHMIDYGFDKGQIELLTDHRMLRYMRDNMNRKALVDKALGNVKASKKLQKAAGRKPKVNTTAAKATPNSSFNDQLSAIDGVLRN
jgi:hypothetical protein